MDVAPQLIEVIYDAPLAPEGWRTPLRALAARLQTPLAFAGIGEPGTPHFAMEGVGASDEELQLQKSNYMTPDRNPFVMEFLRRGMAGTLPPVMVMRTEEVVPLEVFRQSEIYQALFSHHQVACGLGIAVFPEGATGAITFYRPVEQGPAPEEDVLLLRRLEPHMVRALRVTGALVAAEKRAQLACQALDSLGSAIFICDASARVRFANEAARELLASGDGLRLSRRQLQAARPEETTALRTLIREYLFVSLFRACAESLASENASRLAAMERADRNIDELLERLNGTFHRQRQRGIDEELFDVISGFEALTAPRPPRGSGPRPGRLPGVAPGGGA